MISIIICSTEAKISRQLADNIEQSIGTEYELIVIPNQNNTYSIFEAYNLGLEQSKYDICCFMHQDILFHTTAWGQKVISHFENKSIGLIGIAGTKYLGRIPAFWSDNSHLYEVNFIQSDKNTARPTQEFFSKHFNSEISTEVVAVDGVWFCLNRVALKSNRFDVKFKGFHFYDLDICMQILSLGYQVRVVHNVVLEHFSWGSTNISWVKNAFVFYKKWKLNLPIYTNDVDISRFAFYEKKALNKIIRVIDYYKCYEYLYSIIKYSNELFGINSILFLFHNKKTFLRGFKHKIKQTFLN